MSGWEYVGFGLFFGLLFGYIANNCIGFKRAVAASQLSIFTKVLAFFFFYLQHFLGFSLGLVLSALFIIWYDTVPLADVMNHIVKSKDYKLFIGFYFAIAFIIIYFRMPSRGPKAAEKA